MKVKFEPTRAAWWDGVGLALLILALCSQLNIGDIGRDTYATQGYVTKQLKIALPDIALALSFFWFLARTTILRGWRRVWWPPLPCWALLFAFTLSLVHSPSVWKKSALAVRTAQSELDEGAPPIARQAQLKIILKDKGASQAIKEGIADTIQISLYFLVAPLVFVNLLRDRRAAEHAEIAIDRRELALKSLGLGALLAVALALWQAAQASSAAPISGFGSSNAWAAWLAIALPLLLTWGSSDPTLGWARRLALPIAIVGLLSVMSPWAYAAALLGLWATVWWASGVRRVRLGVVALLLSVFCGLIWLQTPRDARRETFLRVDNPLGKSEDGKKVKKQYVEWGAAIGWAMPSERAFATGVGPGNYQGNIGTFYASGLPNEEKMPPDSNNLYLVQGVSIGVLGLGALLWMIGHFAQIAWRARQNMRDNWLAIGLLGSLFSWVLVNFFHASIVRGTGLLLALIFALCVVCMELWPREPITATSEGKATL